MTALRNKCIFLFITVLIIKINGSQDSSEIMSSDTPAHAAKWYVQNHPNGKYFSYEIPSVDQDQMASLLQDGTLPSTKNKRFKGNFTPRLGRDSKEFEDAYIDEYLIPRSSQFIPRLGRDKVNYHFDPRLGK